MNQDRERARLRRAVDAAPVPRGTIVVAHPSPDVYGSDRQLLEVIQGLVPQGWRVVVYLPTAGPLVRLLERCGAEVGVLPFPVLRKSLMSVVGVLRLTASIPVVCWRLARLLRRTRPDVVLVNTVTVPWWLAAARLARIGTVVCHVHEAEEAPRRIVRLALAAPLMMATRVVTNSRASAAALVGALPALRPRTQVIHNGIAGPPAPPGPVPTGARARHLVLVGRLSPRKGIDVALEALALLLARGRDLDLAVYGSVYAGYEWYERDLRARARADDLAGRVEFAGYVNPTWTALARAAVVLVPSRVEPFGNTAVEGLLAGRPVVASRVQGLAEIIDDGRTGLLVPPDDAAALANAIEKVVNDPGLAQQLADCGRADALARFDPADYRVAMAEVVTGAPRRAAPRPVSSERGR